ncbi:putative holin-like toxin [Sporolactobacillus sp. Y61]|uniref:Holin-like toxin n=2 Tax=Sporolactobacillus sp. Y61 TaxID=3160863 RepID=A0AAU8IH34_9BACL
MKHMCGPRRPYRLGVKPMTVFQAITLMISFGVLVLMLSDRKKK